MDLVAEDVNKVSDNAIVSTLLWVLNYFAILLCKLNLLNFAIGI